MSTTAHVEEVIEISLDTAKPKIPAKVTHSLRLSPKDSLVVINHRNKLLLMSSKNKAFEPYHIGKNKIAELHINSKGCSPIPLDVLADIGAKIGGRLKLIRDEAGCYRIEIEFSNIDELFEPVVKEKIAQQKRRPQIRRIISHLTEAQGLLEKAVKFAGKLDENDANENLEQEIGQAIQHIRRAKYFGI